MEVLDYCFQVFAAHSSDFDEYYLSKGAKLFLTLGQLMYKLCMRQREQPAA